MDNNYNLCATHRPVSSCASGQGSSMRPLHVVRRRVSLITRRARRHERQYRRTKLAADRSAWVHFVRDMHRSYREKERTYWETKIVSHAKDPKRLWATFD